MNTAVIEFVNLLKDRAVVFKDDVLADSFESLKMQYFTMQTMGTKFPMLYLISSSLCVLFRICLQPNIVNFSCTTLGSF